MAVLRESPWYEEIKQEGIQIGEQRGIQLGKQEGIQQVARNLLSTDMDPAQVADVTGLTPEQIRRLQN